MKYLPPDHPLLNLGTRCHRGGRSRSSQDPRWLRFQAAALRQWLTQVLGDEDLDQALQVFVEGLSCQTIGDELLDRHKGTACRWRQRWRSDLCRILFAAAARPVTLPGRGGQWLRRWLTEFRVGLLADVAHAELVRSGGCTIDPQTAAPLPPCPVYLVSRAGCEQQFPACPTVRQIAAYVRQWHEALLGATPAFLGGWRNARSGTFFLDLTDGYSDRTAAMAAGRANGQQAITFLQTLEEIWLQEERRTAA